MACRKCRRASIFAAISGLGVVAGSGLVGRADTTATWDGTTNNWSSTAHWSSSPNYPNNGTPSGSLYDVVVGGGTVSLDVSPTIQTLQLSSGTIGNGSGTLTVNGLITWNSGVVNATSIAANGGIAFGNNTMFLETAALTNASGKTATIGASGSTTFYLESGATFTNAGTVMATNGAIADDGGIGTRTFNNNATLNVNDPVVTNVSNGIFTIGSGLVFNNSGSVTVQAGTLDVNAGGTASGSFTAQTGTTLSFGSTYTLSTASSLTGAGTVNFSGNETISTTSFNITGPENLLSGTLSFTVNDSFNSPLTWTSGSLSLASGVTAIAADGMALGNNSQFLVGGTLVNASGQTATLGASGQTTFYLENGATFTNSGTVTACNGSIADAGGAATRTLSNGGTFNVNDPIVAGVSNGIFAIGGSLVFNNTGSINVQVGTLGIGASYSGAPAGAITVSSGATLDVLSSFAQPAGITNNGAMNFSGSGDTCGRITGNGSLTISGGSLALNTGSGCSIASSLTIDTSTTLDLKNNDLIVHSGSLTTLTAEIALGYNGGTWTGSGLTSSAAAATQNTAIGIELNSNGSSALMTAFEGQTVTSTDILIKYTYFGDANLDGVVNGSDYTLIDNGFNNKLTGWRNGDFNYDGVVNGDDYTLIDNAFNTQGAKITSGPSEMIAADTPRKSPDRQAPCPNRVRCCCAWPRRFSYLAAVAADFAIGKIPATGFEPVTSGLGNQRSIQLSYAGPLFFNAIAGFMEEQVDGLRGLPMRENRPAFALVSG